MELSQLNPWVEQEKQHIETVLRQLVDLNTFTANTDGVDAGMEMIKGLAEQYNLRTEMINERHLLVKAGTGQAKPRVLLVSHMDTVHPPESDFKAYHPLADGFVEGPGVGDIKGGLVIGFWAMLALQQLHDDIDVQMIISANEEIGSPTIRDWYMNGHIDADYAIGLEPGFPQGDLTPTVPLGVVYQRRGYGAIHFTIHGRKSHSGTPHLGLNALEASAQRITRLHQLSQPDQGYTVTVGMLEGGTAPNTVPGTATGTVSWRFERLEDGERLRDEISAILEAQYVHNAEFDQWDSADYDLRTFIPPMERSERNQKLVDIVLEEAERLQQNVVPIARGGGSDANFVSKSGTPAICGMGAPAQGIHTDQEKIYLPGLFDRVQLLASTLYRLYTA